MPVDWTAVAVGVPVTAVGSLLTAVALLVRRELNHLCERLSAIEARLREVEAMHFLLSPLAIQMQRKMDEHTVAILP